MTVITIDYPSPDRHLRTEWLLTNGLGGYAMGTVLGINTRRYHGLLVAAMNPPVGRIVALHSIVEQFVITREDGPEDIIDLSTQMFVGGDGEPMVHLQGWRHLRHFSCDYRRAIWEWDVRGLHVRKTVFPKINGDENGVKVIYEAKAEITSSSVASTRAMLRLRPVLALRDFHSLGFGVPSPRVDAHQRERVEIDAGWTGIVIESLAAFREDAHWWRRFAYIEDRDRGMDWSEDLWSPGVFEVTVDEEGGAATIDCKVAATEPLVERVPRQGESAADQFIVARKSTGAAPEVSIIAGYPWFSDWGRDSMISLPGLLLCARRFDEAKSLLLSFAQHMRGGLIPNHFNDATGEACYNTVDASLWFVYAVWQYLRESERLDHRTRQRPASRGHDVEMLLNACREIVRAYREGTDFDIRLDPADSLISAGSAQTQLTWMDAARDGVIFTPRHGKPVEVNALWFNALHCLAEMTDDPNEARDLRDLASRTGESFRAQFWWAEKRCLYDVINSQSPRNHIRGQLRPNQVFAVSLPFSPLSREQQRAVAHCVRERFLTPYGLRTLDRDDPDYQPRFEGDLFARDRAYHNGTVWPWLIGPYCEALMRTNDFSEDTKVEVRAALRPLLAELSRTGGAGCLGQLAEVYDGDPPHRPGGCVAQAWSVAEVMRILALVDS